MNAHAITSRPGSGLARSSRCRQSAVRRRCCRVPAHRRRRAGARPRQRRRTCPARLRLHLRRLLLRPGRCRRHPDHVPHRSHRRPRLRSRAAVQSLDLHRTHHPLRALPRAWHPRRRRRALVRMALARVVVACVAVVAAASLAVAEPAAASVRWFFTPSGNISCEVSSGGARGAYAYCQSVRQPRTVTLGRNGQSKVCRGTRCLTNGPENSTELAYGRSIRVGPFRCTSKRSGMRCVVVSSGHGFHLSREAVRRF